MLNVQLADTCENGIWSKAATAPASLFLCTASDAGDGREVETRLRVFREIIPLPTNTGASKGPWQLKTAVTDPASCKKLLEQNGL